MALTIRPWIDDWCTGRIVEFGTALKEDRSSAISYMAFICPEMERISAGEMLAIYHVAVRLLDDGNCSECRLAVTSANDIVREGLTSIMTVDDVVSCVCIFQADAEHLVTKMKGGVQRGLVLRYRILTTIILVI